MMKLVEFSIARPRLVLWMTFLLCVIAGLQLPRIVTDTNPKNMLPATSEVRSWNRSVEQRFGLYEDMIVVGIVNQAGILNPSTLAKIARLTTRISELDGVAAEDLTSLSNVTNVDTDGDTLRVGPLMSVPPTSEADMKALQHALDSNPLFEGRMISADRKTTAIYVPLVAGAHGDRIAEQIKSFVGLEKGSETYYVAGDPVVRDTFGAEMFRVMAVFAPIAGMIMMALTYWMFRSFAISMTVMMAAMAVTLWSIGGVIAAGYPVHIMTSMAPVFLMAIATDAIHIFNEYSYRVAESPDKASAVRETMRATRLPLIYTDLTTAFAFGSLALAAIIPVRIFGICVAFGTLGLLLLSFTFVPAAMMLLGKKTSHRREDSEGASSRALERLASLGARRAGVVLTASAGLLAVSVWGMTRLVVNNNQVTWFREGSETRVADDVLNRALGGTATANIVLTAPADDGFKTVEGLAFVEQVEKALHAVPEVGATLSLADYVRRMNQVLNAGAPSEFRIPTESSAIGQYIFLLGTAARRSDLANVADPDFKTCNILLQLKTWDISAMRKVTRVLEEESRRAPQGYTVKPAGTAHFGLVWNDEVLMDMLKGFVFGLVAVFLILAANFRSIKWAAVGYVPLALTIAFIYGFIGFVGKDFDMPIAVLSCLSLGMAVDFAIHFVGRLRQRLETVTDGPIPSEKVLLEALSWTAGRPGRGILRNALLFASAFSVMLFAPLTPYVTVGAFMLAMMSLGAVLTILLLPALITLLRGSLFRPARSGRLVPQEHGA